MLYRYVGVIFDEMYLREDLVFDKHQCHLVGFVNVADFGNQMQHLEDLKSDSVNHPACILNKFICMLLLQYLSPSVSFSETSSNCKPYVVFYGSRHFQFPQFPSCAFSN